MSLAETTIRPAIRRVAAANDTRAPESLDAVFGTGPFSHQVVLNIGGPLRNVDALVAAAGDVGACLQALNLAQTDDGYRAKLWLKGIGCDAARRLTDRFASLAAVTYAHVEHHLGAAEIRAYPTRS